MGRIKSTQIKRISRKLYEENKEKFSGDFDENKKSIDKFVDTSKKIRNSIAGYVTKLAKNSNR